MHYTLKGISLSAVLLTAQALGGSSLPAHATDSYLSACVKKNGEIRILLPGDSCKEKDKEIRLMSDLR